MRNTSQMFDVSSHTAALLPWSLTFGSLEIQFFKNISDTVGTFLDKTDTAAQLRFWRWLQQKYHKTERLFTIAVLLIGTCWIHLAWATRALLTPSINAKVLISKTLNPLCAAGCTMLRWKNANSSQRWSNVMKDAIREKGRPPLHSPFRLEF